MIWNTGMIHGVQSLLYKHGRGASHPHPATDSSQTARTPLYLALQAVPPYSLPSPFFSCPRKRNRQRPVPVPVTGVHYNSLLWMCTLNTLTWPDLLICCCFDCLLGLLLYGVCFLFYFLGFRFVLIHVLFGYLFSFFCHVVGGFLRNVFSKRNLWPFQQIWTLL